MLGKKMNNLFEMNTSELVLCYFLLIKEAEELENNIDSNGIAKPFTDMALASRSLAMRMKKEVEKRIAE